VHMVTTARSRPFTTAAGLELWPANGPVDLAPGR
jgi:hypothetical protein